MTPLRRLLKPDLAAPIFEALAGVTWEALPMAVMAEGRAIAASGPEAEKLRPRGAGTVSEDLHLDGVAVGTVVVGGGADGPAPGLARALAGILQRLIEAEHSRKAVSRETLEAYREMALVRRASLELNRTLKPEEVAEVLLAEFAGTPTRVGAVFLRDPETGRVERLASRGTDAEPLFDGFAESPLFEAIMSEALTGIVNQPGAHPGARARDAEWGCLLAVPLRAGEKTLGTLVLLDSEEFPAADLKRAETVASMAAASLYNAQLFAQQKRLFEALVEMVAGAIDAKSPYTSGHCQRVPEISRMLAEGACAAQDGPLADFDLDEEGWEAMRIAAALHDCGKVVTPEWVMDKSTKLETIHDRMAGIEARFAVLGAQAEKAYWQAKAEGTPEQTARAALQDTQHQLAEDLAFIRSCNQGDEWMTPETEERVRAIAVRTWRASDGSERPLLTDDEVENLLIPRGTLLPRERQVIEDHAQMTREMLSRLPFRGGLKAVPEIAGSHHERIDGKGYPLGLSGEELGLEARILAIADVFEALTAPDRPYRKGATLSEAVEIMGQMVDEGQLDPDLFRLMLDRGIHTAYARGYMDSDQVDLA